MFNRLFRSGLVATVAVSSFSLLFHAPVQAESESVSFTLVNKTSRVLEKFYASPPTEDDWEENILTEGLQPGESAEITIDDGREDCLYDFKGVLGPGGGVGRGALIHSKVSVCDGGSYEYTE